MLEYPSAFVHENYGEAAARHLSLSSSLSYPRRMELLAIAGPHLPARHSSNKQLACWDVHGIWSASTLRTYSTELLKPAQRLKTPPSTIRIEAITASIAYGPGIRPYSTAEASPKPTEAIATKACSTVTTSPCFLRMNSPAQSTGFCHQHCARM
jgi:hypothetical protein